MSYRQFPELTPVEEKMGFKLIERAERVINIMEADKGRAGSDDYNTHGTISELRALIELIKDHYSNDMTQYNELLAQEKSWYV